MNSTTSPQPSVLETAIDLPIAAVEQLVGPWRARYDPSAALGVTAHVTLLYPFLPPDRITDGVIRELVSFFASERAFELEFAGICAFATVLYLAPEPQSAVDALIARLGARYPETPPYAGAFADPIPHLTVAQPSDRDDLPRIAAAFARDAAGRLPVRTLVREAALWEQREDGRWYVRALFPLGQAYSRVISSSAG